MIQSSDNKRGLLKIDDFVEREHSIFTAKET